MSEKTKRSSKSDAATIAVAAATDASHNTKCARALEKHGTPDLPKLVELLIPAYLKRLNKYTVKHATIDPDAPLTIVTLQLDVAQGVRRHLLTACLLRKRTDNRPVFNIRVKSPIMRTPAIVTCDMLSDLDEFERRFEDDARLEDINILSIIGHGAVIPYILLCMLVYTEHVFAPLSDTTVTRTQRALPHADATRAMLNRYWDMDKAWEDAVETDDVPYARLVYPFLTRLMPPEFALELDCEKMLSRFIFMKQRTDAE